MSRKAGENGIAEYVDYLNNYNRKARGAGAGKGTDRLSGLDVRYMADAAEDFGVSKSDAAKEVIQYARRNEDNTRMGGATEDALNKLREFLNNNSEATPDPTPDSTPDSTPEPNPAPEATSTSQPKMETGSISATDSGVAAPIQQDNDITVSGNRNKIKQDNSIKQKFITDNSFTDNSSRTYGGDTRIFEYNPSEGSKALYDSPVSAATMGGFFDTSDSPANAQKFMDMYIDSNNLAQRRNKQEYDRTKIIDYAPNDLSRIGDLESDLDKSSRRSFRSSKRRSQDLFGKRPFAGNFVLPKVPNQPKDRTEEISDKFINKIESL